MADATSITDRIRGSRIATGAHRPFPMDDPERVLWVEQGHLDIFAVELDAAEPVGRRRFVARVPRGEMAFGAGRIGPGSPGGNTFGFYAVPSQDAVVVAGERRGVAGDRFDLSAIGWIDSYISRLSDFLARDRPPPRNALLLEADPDVAYSAGSPLSAQHRDVIWVEADAPMRLLGRASLTVGAGGPLAPVTERTWLELDADARLTAMYTPTALRNARLWSGMERFCECVLGFAAAAGAEEAQASAARRRSANEARRASVAGALEGFGEVLRTRREDAAAPAPDRAPLEAAAGLVAESCGAKLTAPRKRAGRSGASPGYLEALARKSRIRTRRIALAPGWWRRDGPSFVGFAASAEDRERPLGVLADGGGYRAVDPRTGAAVAVTAATAAGMQPAGVVFYPPLPDRVENGMAALRFAVHGRRRDLLTLLTVGALGGLTALAVPVLTGQILGRIVPRGDIPLLLAALGALLLAAFGGAVFEIVRGLAVLRIESRVDERLQAAVWSRLIALPAPFFRRFTAGDLADRANGVSQIRQLLTGAALQGALGAIFSVFSLALLFWYSGPMALSVCVLLGALAAAMWAFARCQLRHWREVFRAQGAINGFVFQMISGLAKLRVANAESHALARWAQRYAVQKRESLAARRWEAGQHAVVGMFQPAALTAIFAFVHFALVQRGAAFDLADFLSFNAAFGQLTAAVLSLTHAAATVAGAVPLFERVRPIIDAEPESAAGGVDPGDIRGDIEFANVSFRYSPDGPKAVDNVSFRIRQGDYVAFVGSSGCGKSTLYRLLLGFDRPESGTVFLDGNDLASLDLLEVRGHTGVVLQNGQIVAGSVFENIAGMFPLSEEEAWEAARAAALEDDIRAMPMGMRTVLPEGGAGLSAGQRQRLLIAGALARKPRVLLFDEATSALDNRAQAAVQASIGKLGITRLVIAHRLSSIRDVDRIYVLDAGRIVESGAYDELMERGGVFAALSRRQLVR